MKSVHHEISNWFQLRRLQPNENKSEAKNFSFKKENIPELQINQHWISCNLKEEVDPPSGAVDFQLKTWYNIASNLSERAMVLSGCKHRGYCTSERRVDGKTILVTGANTGIGYSTAEFLWKRGGDVVLLCRDSGRGEAAIEKMKRDLEPGVSAGKLKLFLIDLGSLASVRKCADKLLRSLDRIDILINNAGVMTPPFTLTEDGYELQFAVNHLGHFLLTMLLLPKILDSTPARIINVSSIAHTFCKGVNVYSLNPGYVQTELYRSSNNFMPGFRFIMGNIMTCFVKDWWEGAQTTIHCAICETTDEETGLYYDECRVAKMNPICKDDDLCRWLWDKSMEWTGLDPAQYDPATLPPRRSPSGREDITAVAI